MKIKSKKIRLRNAKLAAGIILAIAGAILAFVLVTCIMSGYFDWMFWLYVSLVSVIIVGVSISLKNRIKEIKDGEEDDASEY